jgi:hypothetical protein
MAGQPVFVSYVVRDAAFAADMKLVLERSGVEAFCATDDLRPGEEWEKRLKNALKECSELVVLLSPESINSSWVLVEIGAAWVLGKRITPVLVSGSEEDIPDVLKRWQVVTCKSISALNALFDSITARYVTDSAGDA